MALGGGSIQLLRQMQGVIQPCPPETPREDRRRTTPGMRHEDRTTCFLNTRDNHESGSPRVADFNENTPLRTEGEERSRLLAGRLILPQLSGDAFACLVGGGVAYLAGALIHSRKWPDPGRGASGTTRSGTSSC
jgi:hypothetical protein